MGFGYDANGRMVKATKANVPDALSVYDAAGMRVAERVNDVWRFSVYDIGGKIVAEYGGVPATDEGGVKYILSDWQGSNRAVLSNTGNVRARVDYTAYGEEIQAGVGLRTSTQGFDNSTALRQRYGLTERDSATGLDHTPWRKNENRAGRWTSPDPFTGSASLAEPQSFNRFSYVANQPTNFIDPSGLFQIQYCTRTWVDYGEGRVYSSWSCVTVYDSGGGGGGPAALSQKEIGKLKKNVKKILKKLQKERCKKFLENAGISIDDLVSQLNDSSLSFSAMRSSETTVEEAGLLGANARAEFEELPDAARRSGLAALGMSVREWFKNNDNSTRRVNAAVGTGGRIFYRGFQATTTLHENLHVLTGLGDVDLANKLGLKFDGTGDSASSAISQALRDNGCS